MNAHALAEAPAGLSLLSRERKKASTSLRAFCHAVDPHFQSPPHIRAVIECLEGIEQGLIDRLMVFMPPRHGKSMTISATFPAYFMGRDPTRDVMVLSYQKKLPLKFSFRVRSIKRDRHRFGSIFPHCKLERGRQPLDEWQTTAGGQFLAAGIESGITGRSANLIICDDILSGRLDASSQTIRDNVYNTYESDIMSRLHPGGAIIMSTTRWHEDDVPGRLLKKALDGMGDEWHVLELPAIGADGAALWPGRYSLDALARIRANLTPKAWLSLYQQRPVEDEGDIILREWWKPWPKEKPLPRLVYLLQSWDTAFEDKEKSDPSACTTWGVFRNEETKRHEMILLGSWQKRLIFADLRPKAKELYDLWDTSACGPVDNVIIEPKASGKAIASELRRAGVPVHEFAMVRGDKGRELDKIAKAHLASVVWHNGGVWYVPWSEAAQPVIDQCAGIGGGVAHDDLADTAMMAAVWLRRSWWLQADADVSPANYPHADRVKLRGAPRNDLTPPERRHRLADGGGLIDERRLAEYAEMGMA